MSKKSRRNPSRRSPRSGADLLNPAKYERLELRNLLAGDPPRLDPIPDLTINEDSGLQVIGLTGIGAGDDEPQPLRVFASSTNPGLIPDPDVTYLTPSAYGQLSFRPNPDLPVDVSEFAIITVTVEDGGPDEDLSTTGDNEEFSRTFRVTVNPINDAPTLDQPADMVLNEDSGLQVVNLTGITAGGQGAGSESQPLSVTVVSNDPDLLPNPTIEYTSPNSGGTLRFTPAADLPVSAPDSGTITITVEDGGLDKDLATKNDNTVLRRTFRVTINPVNDYPTLNPISNLFIDEDSGLNTVNLAGITAGGGESQLLRVIATSNNPALIPNPTPNYVSPDQIGSISFAPQLDRNGQAEINVIVEDAGFDDNFDTLDDNRSFSRTFFVTVNPVNDFPTLSPLSHLTIDEDAPEQTVNLTGITAGGGEIQELRVTAVSSNTALIPNPFVNYTSANPFGSLNFTPVPDQWGIALITVSVEDWGNDGDFSTTADNRISSRTFRVTVNSINDAPTLDPLGNLNAEGGKTKIVNLSGITAGGGENQPLRVTATSSDLAIIPTPTVTYTDPNQFGSISFTPVLNQVGLVTISVTVEDGGADRNLNTAADNATFTRTFEVQVGPFNDPPTLDPLNNLIINENAGQQTVLLSGITAGDGESQPLRVTAISDNPGLIPNPTVDYTPNNQTGQIRFTAVANQSGIANITVTVEDGGLDEDLATPADNGLFSRTFQVSVTIVNDPPTLDPIIDLTLGEDAGEQVVNLTGISAGGGETQPLRITAVSSNAAIIPNPTVNYLSPNPTGSISFTPVANQSGIVTISVTIEDGGFDGDLSTLADNASFTRTFQVTIDGVNDAPTLDPVPDLSINEDAPQQTVNLTGITAGGGENQPLRVTAVSSNPALIPNPAVFYNSPDNAGFLRFTPAPNQFGIATITVRIEDGGLDGDLATPGDNATFSRLFQITVNPVNDAPTIDPVGDLTINEDAPQQIVSLSGITAGGGENQPLRVTAVSNNPGLLPNPTVSYVSPSQTGSILFTPNANQSGLATITITVEDGGLDGDLATTADNGYSSRSFQVTVLPVNDAPTLNPIDDISIDEDAGQQEVSLSGITAGGGESQPLRVTASSSNTSVIPNPVVTYTSPNQNGTLRFAPVANQSGIVTITVSVEDGGLDGNLNTAGDNNTFSRTFQITVNPVNDAPTLDFLNDLTMDEDGGQRNVGLSGISAGGGESQPLRVTALSSNPELIPNPTVNYTSANQNGSLSFAPLANQFGSAIISVKVEDGGLDGDLNTPADNSSFIRTFNVTVNPVNEPPTIDPISDVTLDEDTLETFIDLLGITAGGIKSQPLRVSAFSGNPSLIPTPVVAYQSPNSFGTLRLAPVANKSGNSTITVTVEDGGLDRNLDTTADNLVVSRSFQVTVNPVNDLPTLDFIGDRVIQQNASQQTVNLTGITAGGGETQMLRVTASSSNTALIPDPLVSYSYPDQNGFLRFAPAANRSGTAIITVTVEDSGLDGDLNSAGDNGFFIRTFQVTVTPVNNPPTLNPLGNLDLLEDAPEKTISLTGITAGAGESQPLRVTTSSSNPALIPTPLVNYESPNQTGELRLTPAPNQSGMATITVSVEDGGLDGDLATTADNRTVSQTFTVNVQAVNDSPRLNNFGSDITYTENGPAVKIASAATVVDVDTSNFVGGRLTVSIVNGAQPHDQLTILPTGFLTNDGNSLIFSGKTVATFSGGMGGTPLQVDFVSDAFLNRVQHVIQNVGFQSSSDAPGSTPRQVVFELTDGAGGSTADTFQPTKQIFVNEINDAPILANPGGNISYTEGAAPVRLAGNLNVIDPDSANFAGGQATVQITSGSEGTDRLVILPSSFLTVSGSQLLFAGSVVGSFNGGIGSTQLVINFNSLATLNRVQHILRNVAFVSLADEPSLTVRSVTMQVSDGDGGLAAVVGKQIEMLPINDAPVLSALGGAVAFTENGPPVRITTSAVVTDVDSPNFGGGYLRVNFQSGYQAGDELGILAADGITISGSDLRWQNVSIGSLQGGLSGLPLIVSFNNQSTPTVVQTVLRNVTFRHTSSNPSANARILGVFVNDGDGGSSALLNKQVNVIPVNNAPVIGGISGQQNYRRNSSPVYIATNATVADADNGNFNNGKLTVRITSGANLGNRLLIGGGFGIDASNGIWWQGMKIGTRNSGGGLDYTNLEVTLNSNASASIVQQLMRSLQFQTVRAKGREARVVEFQLTDGSGGTSNVLTKQIAFS